MEIHVGNVKIALEAEQGQSSTKQREAIADADRRLRQGNADCAIAVCYPDGITAPYLLEQSRVLWAIRAPNHRAPSNEVRWADADLDELVSVIKLAPMQLGNPDHAAAALSASLDAAVERLSENQKQEIARALDLPAGKATRLGEGRSSCWNQAAKRAMLVIATAMMFHSRLDDHRHELKPEFDSRKVPGTPFTGAWPPALAYQCAKASDPIGAFDQAWDLWLAVAVAALWRGIVGAVAEEAIATSTVLDVTAVLGAQRRQRRATRLRLVSVFRRGWITILVVLLRHGPLPPGRLRPEPWLAPPSPLAAGAHHAF